MQINLNNFNQWIRPEEDSYIIPYLNKFNNDVVDGDEDQLHEEPNESHHYEPDCCTERDLRELYTTIDHQIHQLQITKSKTPISIKPNLERYRYEYLYV